MSLPRLAIRRPVAVAMGWLAVLMLGALAVLRLPIDLLPDVAYPRLVVHTTYANVAPVEVERFISEPVERVASAVPGVERVTSVSREGVSLVTLRFAWGTDMDFAVLNVRERLDNLRDQLPEGAERPVVLRTDPTSDAIMTVSVAGSGAVRGAGSGAHAGARGASSRGADSVGAVGSTDLWALKELAEAVIKRRLEQVDGIAQAAVTGGLEREIHVEVDPRRLESLGLTVNDVRRALDAANRSAPGGTIRRGRYRYALRTLGELQDVSQIADVPIRREGAAARGDSASRSVLLRDVARVDDGFRERESLARLNGEEAIGLLLFKESGANTVRVSERVEDVLAGLRRQYPELRLVVATSQAGFISDSIANVVQEVVIGGLLAFLVLFLFLRDTRVPVAIALAIPLSVIATFALFDAAGVSINIMSLGGLALGVGLLMDNSIVVVENIFRHRELGLAPAEAAAVGTEEVSRAITGSTLTTIAVFGPIIYVQGVAGELFGSLSLAVAFALGASVLVALTVLPALAARWSAGGGRQSRGREALPTVFSRFLDRFDAGFARLAAWYEGRLAWSLEHRGRVVALSALALALTVPVALALPRTMLPEVDQGSFRVRVELPRGTPLEGTAEVAARVERALLADARVAAVFTRVGRQAAIAGVDDESGLHSAVLDVRLAEGAATADVAAALRPVLAGVPGQATVETGQATALGALLGAGEADLAVRLRGEDLDAALVHAGEVAERLQGMPGLANVRVGTALGHPEVRVTIDRERAASYGIEPTVIAQTVEDYMRGTRATDYVAFDRKVPVMVRLPDADRRSLATLEQVRLQDVPLGELVSIEEGVGPTEIRREEQGRVVAVYADAPGGDLDEAVRSIERSLATLSTPDGLRREIGGENEEMRRSFAALGLALLLALLLVYMILAAEFESFVQPAVVLLSVPLATIGAAVALWVTGAGLNVVSLIGMVVLVGIVDNDAVVKIDFINQMRREGHSVHDAIRLAGHARLRPILINTITAMLGLLPMALAIGPGAQLQAPLAIAVFGGLFTATALTLIVIPVAYSLVEEGRARLWAGPGAVAGASGE
ncbi:MAG TPA: efflux RND transporter permease subunit, partial [Gemmatimonadaceae bacterium]|nr:efflux RND transporter permease subunit [Gemmatimonadaceae bacterium]